MLGHTVKHLRRTPLTEFGTGVVGSVVSEWVTIIVGRGVSPWCVHRSCAPCSILRVLVDVASVPLSYFALDLMAGWVGMLLCLGCCFVRTELWPARRMFDGGVGSSALPSY